MYLAENPRLPFCGVIYVGTTYSSMVGAHGVFNMSKKRLWRLCGIHSRELAQCSFLLILKLKCNSYFLVIFYYNTEAKSLLKSKANIRRRRSQC